MLRDAIGERGGEVIKSTGDGVQAVFHSATDALAAAVSIQQRIGRYSQRPDAIAPLELRIGISVGDVVHQDDDIHGTPVVEAVRLQAAAGAGRIVCSDVVRSLGRGRGGFQFEPLGLLELKGLPEPLAASEVRWEILSEPGGSGLPLPLDCAGRDTLRFVGRENELEWALEQIESADRPTAVWLMGEPGIGKTRLSSEIARRSHADGAIVLFGRCEESMAAPFQPVITALRWYVANVGDSLTADMLGVDPAPLCRLVPEIAARVPGLATATAPASEVEQFRLFESVRDWLRTVAFSRAVLFVIDDAHWADRPTLALLGHVLRGAENAALTILGTARSTAPDASGPLGELMDSLAVAGRSTARILSGLTEADVSALVGTERAESLVTETAGNPLFLSAVLEGGQGDHVINSPHGGVSAAVGRRVRRLAPEVQEMLKAASVLGPEIDLTVTASMCRADESSALGSFEEACGAGLLIEVGVERFRFAHAMVRDVIAASVGATRRTRLHAAAAAAIESQFAGSLDDQVDALAFHHAGAAHPDQALRYAVQAAERAVQLLAFDAAIGYYQMALTQHDKAATAGPATRSRLMLEKGHVQRLAADHAGALETLHDAAVSARERGSWEDYARSVLSFEEASWRPGLRAAEAASLLEDVVGRDAVLDSSLARRAASSLARAYHYAGRLEEARELADRALEEARASGDSLVLVHALTVGTQVRVPILPDEAGEIVAFASEMWDLREQLDDLEEVATVSYYAVVSELILGDRAGTERWYARLSSLTTVVSTRFTRYTQLNMESTRAFLGADLDEAEQKAEQSRVLGQQLGEDVSGVYGLQMFLLRREQDRLGELAPVVRLLLSHNSASEMWRPGLVLLLAELGLVEEGAAQLEELVGSGEHLRSDSLRLATLCFMAEAASALGLGEIAVLLASPLNAWSRYGAVVGNQVSHLGATDRYLAMIALSEGRLREADDLLASALEFNRRLGATLWEAHTTVDLAELRLLTGKKTSATELHKLAAEMALTYGLARVGRRCRQLEI